MVHTFHRIATTLAAACCLLAVAAPAQAMSGGVPVTGDSTARWVATLAPAGDAPLLQRVGCGGVLVVPDRVVTAGHCVDHINPSRTDVHIDARVLSADPGQVRGIRGVATLPGYRLLPSPAGPDVPDLSSARNDPAVILLDRPVTGVRPLRIAGRRPAAGTGVTMYAHGSTGLAGPDRFRNDTLQRGDLVALDRAGCVAATPATVDGASVFCAEDQRGGGVTGCYLDSGSPAVTAADGTPMLAGVFSFGGETAGKTCGQPSPGYFADVTAFRSWVYGPALLRQPYPAGMPVVSGTPAAGEVLRCAPPQWDAHRGEPATTVEYQWATVLRQGPFVIPVPVDGAVTPELAPDGTLSGEEVVCMVVAGNAGGTTMVTSDPVTIT